VQGLVRSQAKSRKRRSRAKSRALRCEVKTFKRVASKANQNPKARAEAKKVWGASRGLKCQVYVEGLGFEGYVRGGWGLVEGQVQGQKKFEAIKGALGLVGKATSRLGRGAYSSRGGRERPKSRGLVEA